MSENRMNMQFKAAVYLRLSKEDGDKSESYSISNQRDLIHDYLKSFPEIKICDEMVDDGYSGGNLDRPGLKRLLSEIEKGNINCVVVKDFSRFGRNYIDAGRYIEELFPQKNIRFIAINDNYDSFQSDFDQDGKIIVSFKNILNDAYLRDISMKVRSQLVTKRKKGEFISPFAVYGYLRSQDDRHSLIIDKNVADNIRNIFQWKIEGMSAQGIADKLNALGIPSPFEYKRESGIQFETPFKINSKAIWTAQAVTRILKNEVYIGVLAQGKQTTVNHKAKTRIYKPKCEWIVVENAHEAIIRKDIFDTVQALMRRDTRRSPYENKDYPYAGLLFCGDCKQNMIHREEKTTKGNYVYYHCSTHRAKSGCFKHNISEKALNQMVFASVKKHIQCIADMKLAADCIGTIKLEKADYFDVDGQIEKLKKKIEECQYELFAAHQNLCRNIISQQEYMQYKALYYQDIDASEASIQRLEQEKQTILSDRTLNTEWMEYFAEYADVEQLTRTLLVMLVDRIYVYDSKRIEIVFRFQTEFAQAYAKLKDLESTIKEAM